MCAHNLHEISTPLFENIAYVFMDDAVKEKTQTKNGTQTRKFVYKRLLNLWSCVKISGNFHCSFSQPFYARYM